MRLDTPHPADTLTAEQIETLKETESAIGANWEVWEIHFQDTWKRHALAELAFHHRTTEADILSRLKTPREWTARGVAWLLPLEVDPRATAMLFPSISIGHWKLKANRARRRRAEALSTIQKGIEAAARFTGKPASMFTMKPKHPFGMVPYGFWTSAATQEDAYKAVRLITAQGGIINRLEMRPPGSKPAPFQWSPLVHRLTCNP